MLARMGSGGTLGVIAARVLDRRFGFASPRGGRLRFRVVSAAAIGLGLLAFGAAPAFAAQRYAAPTPAGTKDCSSAANACGLATAIEGAAKGDEVIIEPGSSGSYGTAGTPLSSTIQSGTEDLDVHGAEISPGPPSAVVHSEAAYGVSLYGAGSTISDLEIVDSGALNGGSLLLEGASGERLIMRSGPKERDACVLELTTVLRDSVCDSAGDVAAVAVSGTLDGPNEVTLRNVTAIDPTGGGIEATSDSFTERSVKLSVLNTIVRGGLYDILGIRAINPPAEPVSITTSHSNYRAADTKLENGATLTDDGTSQTTGDQTEAQLFAEPLGGNFQEALGAQTIGAGLIEAENGTIDFYGYPRVLDSGGECASTDIGAGQFIPAGAPTISTPTAGAVGETTASLSATANPLGAPGTAHFDYGPAASGGGQPTSYSSTPVQCLPVGDVAQPVVSTLTSLLPGTIYYYRLVAANESATSTPAFTATFTTTRAAPIVRVGCACRPAPVLRLSGLSETAKTWREGNALAQTSAKKHGKKKPPIGTTFTFNLNESASVTFTFTTTARGRTAGTRCVAETKKNKNKKRCTRTVTAGTLTFSGYARANKVTFDGLLSSHRKLKPGSYTLTAAATASGEHSTPQMLHFTISS